MAVLSILSLSAAAQAQPTAVSISPSFSIISIGQTVTLVSTTTGTGPFSYQWNQDGVPIAGATGSSLQVTGDAAYFRQGAYSVTVNNAISLTSAGVQVSVKRPAPTITLQPQSQAVPLNSIASFSVGISGYDPAAVDMLWFHGTSPNPSNPIQVGNGPSLNIAVTSPFQADNYFVRVGGFVTGPIPYLYTEYAYKHSVINN